MKLIEPIILFIIHVFKKSLDAAIACLNQLNLCKTKLQLLSWKYFSQAYYTKGHSE